MPGPGSRQSACKRAWQPAKTRRLHAYWRWQPTAATLSRRRVVKAGLILLGGARWAWGDTGRSGSLPLLADVRTGVGEQRSPMLSNGTALMLNTASAVDVDDALGPARLLLRQGEVMVTVPTRQHCTVSTRNGTVEAGAKPLRPAFVR